MVKRGIVNIRKGIYFIHYQVNQKLDKTSITDGSLQQLVVFENTALILRVVKISRKQNHLAGACTAPNKHLCEGLAKHTAPPALITLATT